MCCCGPTSWSGHTAHQATSRTSSGSRSSRSDVGASLVPSPTELLTRADVPFDVVLENPSNYGVQMALASGAGIALINRRLLTDQHTEWEPPDTRSLRLPGSAT